MFKISFYVFFIDKLIKISLFLEDCFLAFMENFILYRVNAKSKSKEIALLSLKKALHNYTFSYYILLKKHTENSLKRVGTLQTRMIL
ncbi:hypothetical protein OTEC02_09025 [Acinetobacter lactucae]|nr:hypothetical protein OTEC02_09025 [Acinetobacter lactucae]